MRGQAADHKRTSTVPYQIAVRTSRPAQDVLQEVAARRVPGMAVAERGPHYLVLRQARRIRYGADIAAGLGIAIVLVLLALTAATPLVLVGLPVALLPALPLLLDYRPDLAVSAIEEEGTTRVTAHGQASADLAEYLDEYLQSLPSANGSAPTVDGGTEADMSNPTTTGNWTT